MKVLHLMSCRGWSSDAYWAASVTAELARAGHDATLVCRRGTEARVIDRARAAGVEQVATLTFASGVRPRADAADVRALVRWLADVDVVHVHRGKEHWLAALANRLAPSPRPIVRTRHILQAVRPHALNRWLYGSATSRVVAVTEAIRRQYLAAQLLPADRIVTLRGGVDLRRFHPGVDGTAFRRSLGVDPSTVLIGVVGNLRVMKGHEIVVEAVRQLAPAGSRWHVVFVGAGNREPIIRHAIAAAGLERHVSLAGFADDLPAAMAGLDVAVYAALESEGMSRVIFEYMAMGKAIAATRVGVVPEVLVDGRTALLVPAGEAAPLASAVRRLVDDLELRRRLGAEACARARGGLSGADVARALGDLYERVAQERATAP